MRRYISKRLRRAAKGQPCVRCGAQDETVVLAHLPGAYYGAASGTSQKTHDWLGAHLCGECHGYVDSAEGRKDTQTRMFCLVKTLERLFESGVLRSIG